MNTYFYANANPVHYFDPNGRSATLTWGTRIIGGGICLLPVPGARVVGIGLIVATIPGDTPQCSGGSGGKSCEDKETCASKYPNYISCSKLDLFNYNSKKDTLNSFGIKNAKLHNPSPLEFGVCAGTAGAGIHWNVRVGSQRLGSITSCKCCQNTPDGPVLKTKFRVH